MRGRATVIGLVFFGATVACGAILGIDDRTLDPEIGVPGRGDAGADVGSEGAADTGARLGDAGIDVDAGFTCPTVCTRCNGEVCVFDCPSPQCTDPIVCPSGLACRVNCRDDKGCDVQVVDCTRAKKCVIDCDGNKDTCNDMKINAGTASLCIMCKGSQAACDQVSCSGTGGCTRICSGGVGGSCTTATCSGTCSGGSSCP